MNSLMATIEVKGLHHTAMMRREAEMHPHIQDIANESCSNVLQEEVESYMYDPRGFIFYCFLFIVGSTVNYKDFFHI